MILLLWIPIWLFSIGSQLVLKGNYYIHYSNVYNYTFLLLLPIIFIFCKAKINDMEGKPLPLAFKSFIAIIFGISTVPYLDYLYIQTFGDEKIHIVQVDNKQKVYARDKSHSYIYVSAENYKETLDYTPLYLQVDIGSQLLIKQKTSLLGYTIKYKDIQILTN